MLLTYMTGRRIQCFICYRQCLTEMDGRQPEVSGKELIRKKKKFLSGNFFMAHHVDPRCDTKLNQKKINVGMLRV